MDSENPKLRIFFFPYLMAGHLIPMIDVARVFASHDVKATIVTTPQNAILYQKTILRDQQLGLNIDFLVIKSPITNDSGLPDGCENQLSTSSVDMSIKLFWFAMNLKEPFDQLLRETKPDCIITDTFYPWTADIANDIGIPRIVFHAMGCFPQCVDESIKKYAPHKKVNSDDESFTLPGLPHKIELTKSMLPDLIKTETEVTWFFDAVLEANVKSYGAIINCFYEFEPEYAEYYKEEVIAKTWHIGPVSLYNKNMVDIVERGSKTSIDEKSCSSWLDLKEPGSVLYICFGSLPRIAPAQVREIAYALEASDYPFIWVIGKMIKSSEGKPYEAEELLPQGFEENVLKSNRGLIIHGWAPQLLILQHEAVGGFMTHCGWNSLMESVSAGVPMITWPFNSEQFYNEKLLAHVLKIAIPVGNKEWIFWLDEPRLTVSREKVRVAVDLLMGEEAECLDMGRRTKEFSEKAKKAVAEGGSSYSSIDAFLEELKSLQKTS